MEIIRRERISHREERSYEYLDNSFKLSANGIESHFYRSLFPLRLSFIEFNRSLDPPSTSKRGSTRTEEKLREFKILF